MHRNLCSLIRRFRLYNLSTFSILASDAEVANSLGLDVIDEGKIHELDDDTLVCGYLGGALHLWNHPASRKKTNPFKIDFLDAKNERRKTSANTELVCKAVGNTSNKLVVDLTAGLGRDSFLLATRGHTVVMFERNNVLYRLLLDALERLKAVDPILSDRMQLYHLDVTCETTQVFEIVQRIRGKLDREVAVYLDPMYPDGSIGSKASVKKESQILRSLTAFANSSDDSMNNQALFKIAQALGSRIVVKRPINGECIVSAPRSSSVIRGSSQRFDVYVVNH